MIDLHPLLLIAVASIAWLSRSVAGYICGEPDNSWTIVGDLCALLAIAAAVVWVML